VKAVEAILVIALLILLVVYATLTVLNRRREARAPWRMVEDSDGEAIQLFAARPGQERLLIGYVPFAAPDFDSRLYELRAEGRQKLLALNEERRRGLPG
jgi:hypothetical protein